MERVTGRGRGWGAYCVLIVSTISPIKSHLANHLTSF